MKASKLPPERYPDFPEFRGFGIPLDLIHQDVLLVLQNLRSNSGIPIVPSPVHGGWARTSGSTSSRHYAVGRLSDAGDVFPERGRLLECWLRAQEMPKIGALGLYGDTNGPDGGPWPMMHFDLREGKRVFWVRENKSRYWYLYRDPPEFWRALGQLISIGA